MPTLFAILGIFSLCLLFVPASLLTRLTSQVRVARWVFVSLGLIFLASSTSFVRVGSDEVGHLKRVYFGAELPRGRYIALEGQKGPQARVISPGFHFMPLINLFYSFENKPVLDVPQGQVAVLTANDGKLLPEGQAFAPPVSIGETESMFTNAMVFLEKGGYRGRQTTVLGPGKWPVNQYLFKYELAPETVIATGEVGVVRSNVHSDVNFGTITAGKPASSNEPSARLKMGAAVTAQLVQVGAIGIWDTPLPQGRYLLNPEAYNVSKIRVEVQPYVFRGKYSTRKFDVTVDSDGKIGQTSETIVIPEDPSATSEAVDFKVDGWPFYQELRILAQVTPEEAPFVVATLGNLEAVRDRVIVPTTRSVMRDVGGGAFLKVPLRDSEGQVKLVERAITGMDFIVNRGAVQELVKEQIARLASKAGVTVVDVLLANTDFPPELLVTSKRTQLAEQLKATFVNERAAQEERIKRDFALATAERQSAIAEAEIQVMTSKKMMEAKSNQGQGERLLLEGIAAGQKAQADVLGQDRVVELRKFEAVVAAITGLIDRHPELLAAGLNNAQKFVPQVVAGGGAGGIDALSTGILSQLLRPETATREAGKNGSK